MEIILVIGLAALAFYAYSKNAGTSVTTIPGASSANPTGVTIPKPSSTATGALLAQSALTGLEAFSNLSGSAANPLSQASINEENMYTPVDTNLAYGPTAPPSIEAPDYSNPTEGVSVGTDYLAGVGL